MNPMREFIHRDTSHVHQHFEEFQSKHGKEYKNHNEKSLRKTLFHQNLR
jgi:hypothetical protein